MYSQSQEVEKCYIALVSEKPEQHQQGLSTHVSLVTQSTNKTFLIKLFIEVTKQMLFE